MHREPTYDLYAHKFSWLISDLWDLVVLELQLKTKQETFNHLACIGSLGLPVQTNVLAGKEESWRPVFLLMILETNHITYSLK